MSQIMERWPWPKANTNMKNECQCGTNEQVSTSLNKFKPAQTQQQKQQQHGAAVKLILWPSGEAGNSSASDIGLKNNNISDKTSSAVNSASMDQINKKTSRNKMWSKLPLRQIPSSLSAKMGWLGGTGETHGSGAVKQPNAVFRSNSFRFERPPPEDDARMYLHGGRHGPIKSYSITAQDIASLNDKYEVPKDFVNRKPLNSYMTPKNQRAQKFGAKYAAQNGGVHIATLERDPLDVVYSDPKDSKLYQVPGAEPRPETEDVIYKVYASPSQEKMYCRPYITMKHSPALITQTTDQMKMMSEYEEVNATDNCVTMITVMPGTTRSTLTSSGGQSSAGLAEAGGGSFGVLDMQTTSTSTRESETSSSEGGSFIIDSTAFYENLNFHRMRSNVMVRTASTDEDLSGPSPNWAKFGYSQKEVWNWLYTDNDINQNRRIISTASPASISSRPVALSTMTSVRNINNNNKAVEVKFTLTEFVECYRRLLGLNLEGFTEFVSRTLEAIISTSMYVSSQKNKAMTQTRANSKCCQTSKKASYIMVPSLQRSAMRSSASQSSQNKTYVRLSMKQPQDQLTSIPTATAGAFSCYQTLIDINNSKYHETVVEDMIPNHGINNQLSIDLNLPLDRQEWYHGSITRHEAENALRLHEEGSFLVRNSESSTNDYSLSVKTTRGFMHMKIQERPGQGYILGQFSKPFRTIAQMLLYYSRNSLPVKGAEHITLKKPVCEQLL